VGLILMTLGACCSYIIVATAGFFHVMYPGGASWYWTVLALAVVTPLSFLRSMDALRFTSLAAAIIIFFLTLLILVYSLGFDDNGLLDPCAGVHWNATYVGPRGACPPGPFDAAGSPWGVLSAFSSLAMAYGAQLSIPTIFNEMEDPSPNRMLLVYVCGYGFAWILYNICAMCGYSTFGSAVTSNILDSYPDNALVSAGRIGLALVVVFSYPILGMGFRNAVVGLWSYCEESCCVRAQTEGIAEQTLSDVGGSGDSSGPFVRDKRVWVALVGLLGISGIVGFTVTDIGIVADITGSLGAMTVSFIAPASVFCMLLRDEPISTPRRALSALVTTFGCVMLVIGLYTAFCECTERPWARLHPHAH